MPGRRWANPQSRGPLGWEGQAAGEGKHSLATPSGGGHRAPQLRAVSPRRKAKATRALNSGGAGWQHHLPTPPDPPSFQA